jgi:flagellar biosynthesis component FlhA
MDRWERFHQQVEDDLEAGLISDSEANEQHKEIEEEKRDFYQD